VSGPRCLLHLCCLFRSVCEMARRLLSCKACPPMLRRKGRLRSVTLKGGPLEGMPCFLKGMKAFQASTLAPHPPFFFSRIEIGLSTDFVYSADFFNKFFSRKKKPCTKPVSTLKSAIKATPTVFPLSLSCFFLPLH
jgi:hypothetical protein